MTLVELLRAGERGDMSNPVDVGTIGCGPGTASAAFGARGGVRMPDG